MDKSGIYYIQNLHDRKIYIGSAISIIKRWSQHKRHLNKGDHPNNYLQSAWDKHGEDSFLFGIIEIAIDKNILLEREQYWIDCYGSAHRSNGYNLAPVAGSMFGFKHSEETKKKLSEHFMGKVTWNKGKKMDGTYKENHLRAMQSDKMKSLRRKKSDGFRHTEETKKKISEASAKRIVSDATRKKMSSSMLGKKLGEGHRQNCIKAWERRKLKTQQHNKKEE